MIDLSKGSQDIRLLIRFFRDEALSEGEEGDINHWTPARTACEVIRRLLKDSGKLSLIKDLLW